MQQLFYINDERLEEAERALKASEGRVINELNAHRFSIIIFGVDGACLSANQQWQRLYRLDFKSVKNYNILQDDNLQKKPIWDSIAAAFAGRPGVLEPSHFSPAEWGQPGRSRWTEGHCLPIFSTEDNTECLLGVMLALDDITEMRQVVHETERLQQQVSEMYTQQEELLRGFSSYRDRLLSASSARPKTMPSLGQLRRKAASIPKREQEVFDLLASGCTVKEAAHVLDLAVKSVYTYRTRLMERLRLTSAVELAVAWRELQEPADTK